MKIELHPNFKKYYKKRIATNPQLVKKTLERIELFQQNPKSPILRSHKLLGKKNVYWAFSVTGDIRIVYFRISQDHVIFLDIGTHSQVY